MQTGLLDRKVRRTVWGLMSRSDAPHGADYAGPVIIHEGNSSCRSEFLFGLSREEVGLGADFWIQHSTWVRRNGSRLKNVYSIGWMELTRRAMGGASVRRQLLKGPLGNRCRTRRGEMPRTSRFAGLL